MRRFITATLLPPYHGAEANKPTKESGIMGNGTPPEDVFPEMPRPFASAEVETCFAGQPSPAAEALLALRALVLETAEELPETGGALETLKWGQPAYLPKRPKVGTTLRMDAVKGDPGTYALYFHCQSRLGETYRELYGDTLTIVGDRSIVLDAASPAPREALRHCIALALTYHLRKRTGG